jgi:transcriptional regulator with XRE-family HTH domain
MAFTIDDELRAAVQQKMDRDGLSLNRLAREAGVTQSSLYRFMFAYSRRRPSKQAKLAAYLGLSLESQQKTKPK